MGVLERIRKAKEQFAAARTLSKQARAGRELRMASKLREENAERKGLLEVRRDFLSAKAESKALKKEEFAGSRFGLFMAAGKKAVGKLQARRATGNKGMGKQKKNFLGGAGNIFTQGSSKDLPYYMKPQKAKKNPFMPQ